MRQFLWNHKKNEILKVKVIHSLHTSYSHTVSKNAKSEIRIFKPFRLFVSISMENYIQ